MVESLITSDPVSMLLAVGGSVSFISALMLVSGRSGKKRVQFRSKPAPLEIVTASSASFRADAAARARSSASASGGGYRLAGVRPVPPAGHLAQKQDDTEQDRVEARARASAIAFHIAENDPQWMAEVITQWIRTDPNSKKLGNP